MKLALVSGTTGKEGFGLYSLIVSCYVAFNYIFSVGGAEYVLKRTAIEKEEGALQVAFPVGSAFIIFFGSVGSAANYWGDVFPLRYVCYVVLLSHGAFFYSCVEAYLRSVGHIYLFSFMMFLRSVLIISLVFAFQIFDFISVDTFICLEIFSFYFVGLFGYFPISRAASTSLSSRVSILVVLDIFKHGWLLGLANFSKNLFLVLDKLIIGFFLGVAAVGEYSFFYIVYSASLVAVGMVMSLIGPVIIRSTRNQAYSNIFSSWRLPAGVAFFWFVALVLCVPLEKAYSFLVLEFYPGFWSQSVAHFFYMIYTCSVILAFTSLLEWVFVAFDKESFLLRLNSALLFSSVALYMCLGFFGVDLVYFVLVFMISRIIYLLVMMLKVFRFYFDGFFDGMLKASVD